MSEPSPDVLAILERLSHARSNWERAQLLFQSWRRVRSLSPEQREQLALHAGVDGAELLIEHLARHSGKKTPPELPAALRSLEQEDPRKLARLVESLRAPGTFQNQQVISDAAQRIGSRMLDAAAQAHQPPTAGGPAAMAAAPPVAPAPLFGDAPWPPGSSTHTAAATPSEPALAPSDHPSSTSLPGASLPSTSPQIPSARSSKPAPAPGAPAPTETPTVPATPVARPRAPQPALHDGWARLQRRPATPDDAPRDDEASGVSMGSIPMESPDSAAPGSLAARLRSEAQLLRRFRLLHESAEQLGGLDDEGCERVIESFPPGWARRRALSAVIDAGALRDPQRAERAVARVESASFRSSLRQRLAARK